MTPLTCIHDTIKITQLGANKLGLRRLSPYYQKSQHYEYTMQSGSANPLWLHLCRDGGVAV